ncbi:MAG: ABC transporter substrate-binding protein [Acidobacteria bacterium]|nr:MAG: ABC transporter substrate-binding protein [Acidobacteriota bacterium]
MKRYAFVVYTLLAASVSGSGPRAHAQSPSIRVLSSNGVKAVVLELQSDIERTIGRSLSIEFSTASSLARNIGDGESFDVAILPPALIEDLIAENKIVAESRVDFARTGVGVGARPDSGTRDVSTPATLKATLLAAESVAFTADGQSRATIDAVFAELEITQMMQSKALLLGPEEAPHAVAAGEAEIALTLVSEILPVPGLELVGPLPAELQNYVSFTAARGVATGDARGADALLEYLAGPAFAAVLRKYGMEPIGR